MPEEGERLTMNAIEIAFTVTAALVALSLFSAIATVVFRKKLPADKIHIFLWGLLPVACSVVLLGSAFMLCLGFFMV